MKKVFLAIVASFVIVTCAPRATPEPSRLTIRTTPDPNPCPMAGLPVPMRFRIDPHAYEQVIAIAFDGRSYFVWWAPGF